MLELDNLDIKILTHLLSDSMKSFQEVAKQCLTSVPTVKSGMDRLVELGVIRKFTLDIDHGKLGISEAVLLVNVRHNAVNRLCEELLKLEEVRELFVTSDSEAAIVSRVSGDMQRIFQYHDNLRLLRQEGDRGCGQEEDGREGLFLLLRHVPWSI
ncbi:transcription regulator [groundwater metagenome]